MAAAEIGSRVEKAVSTEALATLVVPLEEAGASGDGARAAFLFARDVRRADTDPLAATGADESLLCTSSLELHVTRLSNRLVLLLPCASLLARAHEDCSLYREKQSSKINV